MRPRVLCLVQLPPPVHGAAVMNRHVIDSELLGSQFDIDALPLQFAASIEELSTVSLRKVVRAASTAGKLFRRLVSNRPDLVYFTLSPAGGAFYRDVLYVAIMKAFAVPRVFHMHGKGVAGHLHHRIGRALCSWVFDGAHVIHLSRELLPDTDSVIDASRVAFVANGIPDCGPVERSATQAPPKILFLSHMVETKGPLVLVDALAELHRNGHRFDATFAGAPFHDGCVARFERAVAEAGLSRFVRYVGPVHGAEKEQLFLEHDVFALPSFNDAFPLVILEAMQKALPVISTFEGAIPEIVVDGETGLLVPSNDPQALATALEQLLKDPVRRIEMGRRGRERYCDRYTIAHFERSLATALDACLEAQR